MSEAETIEYKRQLVLSHKGEISTGQAEDLLYHPARTQGQIDAYFEKLLSDFVAQRKADEAFWLKERNAATVTPAGTGSKENP